MQNTYLFSNKHFKVNDGYYLDISDKIRIKKVVSIIGSNKIVLDLGCYDGTISEKIKKNNNIVYGIDASEDAINIAKDKGIIASVGNIEQKLPYNDNMFDVVFAGEVIEHILDTDNFINEIKRILKKGGDLVVTTPNVASLGRRLLLLIGKNPYFEASFSYPKSSVGHIRFFTKKLLINFLLENNFHTEYFCSDVVKINSHIGSEILCNIFPNFGRSLIVKCKLKKE